MLKDKLIYSIVQKHVLLIKLYQGFSAFTRNVICYNNCDIDMTEGIVYKSNAIRQKGYGLEFNEK